jgi:RNA polymerase sigma-70 factor (ECF subfamily)
MQDHELLMQLRTEETRESAFSTLVSTYQSKVYNIVRKMVIDHEDTNDIVQETFVKVWHKVAEFKGESQLYTWIYRVATNEALQFLRKRKRRMLFWSDNSDLENYLADDVALNGDEIQLKLQKAILKLPDRQRLVFNLKYFEELKYEEISEILNTSVGSLKANYHHAVKKIEKFINED